MHYFSSNIKYHYTYYRTDCVEYPDGAGIELRVFRQLGMRARIIIIISSGATLQIRVVQSALPLIARSGCKCSNEANGIA